MKRLTSQELALLMDKELMPAKQSLLLKLEKYLASLGEGLRQNNDKFLFLPEEISKSSPKISKGENYNLQPYRVLDYPRSFSGKDIFTFRTLVLWGHEIGFHLILGGKYKEVYQNNIAARFSTLPKVFLFSVQDTPWTWEASAEGLVRMDGLDEKIVQKHLSEKLFIKLSYYVKLENYGEMVEEGSYAWEAFLRCLKA